MHGKIIIPGFSPQHWADLLEDASPAEEEITRTQQMLAALAEPVNQLPATAERVSWLALWSRAWEIAAGLRGQWSWPSAVVREALGRSCTDLQLHLSCLGEAVSSGIPGDQPAANDMPARAREALLAYLAWILDADLRTVREMLEKRNLEGTYDPTLARAFLTRLGEKAEEWQATFGEVEEVSDQEAELDQRRAVANLRKKEARLAGWLGDPALRRWAERLATRKRDHWSLPELLLGAERTSARRQMRAYGTEFGYSAYQRQSQVIHGSTLENYVVLGTDGIGPILLRHDPEAGTVLLSESLRLACLPLLALRTAVLPVDNDS